MIFRSKDVVAFLGKKLADPDRPDGSRASRLWDWKQKNARKGGLASAAGATGEDERRNKEVKRSRSAELTRRLGENE